MEWALLANLSVDARSDVLRQARRRRFQRNTPLFHQDDPSDGLHLIDSGWVAVRLTTARGDIGTAAVLGPGDTLGELSLIGDTGRRSTAAVAITPVETIYVNRAAFDALRNQHPSVNELLLRILGDRLRHVTDRLVEALFVPAPTRVLRRIADLGNLFASVNEVPLTQEDIAGLAGTTRPTVNRALKDAEAKGALKLSRGRIRVLDAERLDRLSDRRA